jgi:processive 1,2-diacylglycerol beta-glucosyltransferase
MKNFLSLFVSICFYQLAACSIQSEAPARKKIVVFTSKGGGGHMSATRTLTHYLSQDYDITPIIFIDILGPLDPVRKFTFQKYTGEDLYNYGLRKGWNYFINNILAPIGISRIQAWQDQIKELAYNYLEKLRPDLIISVMGFFNASLLDAAKRLNIPFLVVTTDLDTSNYIIGISKPDYKKFYYSIPFDDQSIREKIKSAEIPESQIKVLGFPVRSDFLAQPDIKELKIEFGVPADKFVIMLLMGASGSKDLYNYLKALSKQKNPIHIIVCLGRNELMRRKIRRLMIPPHITLTVVGFTDRISDLMSISDVLVTKPGPNTLCEAFYKNLPVILDGTHSPLYWEFLNIDFVVKNKLGDVVSNYKQLHDIINKYMTENYKTEVLPELQKLHKPDFGASIKSFVKEILEVV